MMEQTKFIAFSTQKGGVGKTTFTVLIASYLYYVKGFNVAIVDCDYPQHSISAMRKRDAEQIKDDQYFKVMAFQQFKALGKKAYAIINSSPENAKKTADDYINNSGETFDFIFFDLPGTVNSDGVIKSLSSMDYIFTPIIADKIVLESCLSFASAVDKLLVKNEAFPLSGLFLFWNKVDGREKTNLYKAYEKTIKQLKLPLLKTFIPDSKKYKKEIVNENQSVFRSTLLPPDRRMLRGSNLEDFINEILNLIK